MKNSKCLLNLDTRVLKFQRFVTVLHGRVISSRQHSSRFLCNNKCPFNIWLRSVVLWVLFTETSRLLWVCLHPGQHTSLPAASGSPQATYLPRRPLAQSGAQIRLAHVSEGLPDAEVSRLCSLSARLKRSAPSAQRSPWYKRKGHGC